MCEMNRFVIRSNKRVCINNIITTNSISYYRHLDKVTKGKNYINNQIKYLSTANGYKSFGSFHSDDVEVLIRQDPNTYVKPELPSVMQHEYDKFCANSRDSGPLKMKFLYPHCVKKKSKAP